MKTAIYDSTDYKDFVQNWIKSKDKNGHGQLSRIAKHLNISSVSVSYIFNGERNLSEEQAIELAEFLGLTEIESDYFLILVQYARAGSKKLEAKYSQQIKKFQNQALKLKNRVPDHQEMDESAKAIFYSNWYFSSIRLITSIEGLQNIDAISDYLQISRVRVHEVMEFLLKYGLCVEKNGKLIMGPKRTHIESKSVLAATHHRNWRLKALDGMKNPNEEDLFFTGPMTLSVETLSKIRKELVDLISSITKSVEPSPSEVLACVNLDLFQIRD